MTDPSQGQWLQARSPVALLLLLVAAGLLLVFPVHSETAVTEMAPAPQVSQSTP